MDVNRFRWMLSAVLGLALIASAPADDATREKTPPDVDAKEPPTAKSSKRKIGQRAK
jgi:hypothetical protein